MLKKLRAAPSRGQRTIVKNSDEAGIDNQYFGGVRGQKSKLKLGNPSEQYDTKPDVNYNNIPNRQEMEQRSRPEEVTRHGKEDVSWDEVGHQISSGGHSGRNPMEYYNPELRKPSEMREDSGHRRHLAEIPQSENAQRRTPSFRVCITDTHSSGQSLEPDKLGPGSMIESDGGVVRGNSSKKYFTENYSPRHSPSGGRRVDPGVNSHINHVTQRSTQTERPHPQTRHDPMGTEQTVPQLDTHANHVTLRSMHSEGLLHHTRHDPMGREQAVPQVEIERPCHQTRYDPMGTAQALSQINSRSNHVTSSSMRTERLLHQNRYDLTGRDQAVPQIDSRFNHFTPHSSRTVGQVHQTRNNRAGVERTQPQMAPHRDIIPTRSTHPEWNFLKETAV